MALPNSDSFIMRNTALEKVAGFRSEKNDIGASLARLGAGVAAVLTALHLSATGLGAGFQAERIAGIGQTSQGVFSSALESTVTSKAEFTVTGPSRGRGHTGAVRATRYET